MQWREYWLATQSQMIVSVNGSVYREGVMDSSSQEGNIVIKCLKYLLKRSDKEVV